MTDKKQDMRPFSLVFGAFGLFIGITFSKMYDMMWYHVFTLAGIFAILAPFLFGQKETIVHTEEIKKKFMYKNSPYIVKNEISNNEIVLKECMIED